jgi:hypothetical protein
MGVCGPHLIRSSFARKGVGLADRSTTWCTYICKKESILLKLSSRDGVLVSFFATMTKKFLLVYCKQPRGTHRHRLGSDFHANYQENAVSDQFQEHPWCWWIRRFERDCELERQGAKAGCLSSSKDTFRRFYTSDRLLQVTLRR